MIELTPDSCGGWGVQCSRYTDGTVRAVDSWHLPRCLMTEAKNKIEQSNPDCMWSWTAEHDSAEGTGVAV